MTLIMRDSVTPLAIPLAGTDIAAGYLDGSFSDVPELAARFPHVPNVLIDVNGSNVRANVRDWETGDKGGNLETWVADHNTAAGVKDAVVYCNRSTIPEVRQLTGSQILGKDYFLWVATLDGTLFTPADYPGALACQDKGSSQVHANYDESVVWTTAPVAWTGYKPDVPPVVVPPPALPAQWTYGTPRYVTAKRGRSSFSLTFTAPSTSLPLGLVLPGITEYEVAVVKGKTLTGADLLSYPRFPAKAKNPQTFQGGSLPLLGAVTVGVRVYDPKHASPWATVTI
jgi:hypothetical protein